LFNYLFFRIQIITIIRPMDEEEPWIKENPKQRLFHCCCNRLEERALGYLDSFTKEELEEAVKYVHVPFAKKTATHEAAAKNLCKVLARLHELQVDLNTKDQSKKWTPILHAVWAGHREAVELLLNLGVDKTDCPGGKTLLHYASMRGHDELVVFLVKEAGFDPLAKDSKGKTAKDVYKGGSWAFNKLLK